MGWKINQFITVNHRNIEVGRDPWRSAVQPATQSRVNSKTRLACSGPCLGKFGESPRMEVPLALWSLCPHCTTIMGNNVFLCLMGISLVAICVYHLLSLHCVPLRSVWLHRYSLGSRRLKRNHPPSALLFSRLSKSSFLSLSLYIMCSSPLTTLIGLHSNEV